MNYYQEKKRKMFSTRDFRERLKLMYLVRGLAWRMEQEKKSKQLHAEWGWAK